ncbi:hypothetical protein F8388_017723 [Cannabis sativa]|uniref:Ubiquitin-like protein ATG12 n=1 Tax=Cannabis sativa TaxID=3483 RepID=A0A7J6HIZ1_CANSA|nr:hypothetical protein F8388_017723 [Cannabis sativa]
MATTMDSPTAVRKAVVVHLRATGDAPILKQAKFKASFFMEKIQFCIWAFVCLVSQFVYVNSAFSPNPDESVIDLYNVLWNSMFFMTLF